MQNILFKFSNLGRQAAYWDTTLLKCVSRLSNGVGPANGACANCMCLYQTNLTCSANTPSGVCQCPSTSQYFSTIVQRCLIYRGYGDSCDSDTPAVNRIFLCASGLTCQLTPTCMCPQTVGNSSCDCLITQYWDGSS